MKTSNLPLSSSLFVIVASTPENILNKTESLALEDLSTESTSSSTNVPQTEAQSKNGQIASKLTFDITFFNRWFLLNSEYWFEVW